MITVKYENSRGMPEHPGKDAQVQGMHTSVFRYHREHELETPSEIPGPHIISEVATSCTYKGGNLTLWTGIEPRCVGNPLQPHPSWKLPLDTLEKVLNAEEFSITYTSDGHLQISKTSRLFTVRSPDSRKIIVLTEDASCALPAQFRYHILCYSTIVAQVLHALYRQTGLAEQDIPSHVHYLIDQLQPIQKTDNHTPKQEKVETDIGNCDPLEVPSPQERYDDIVGAHTLKLECRRIYRDLTEPHRASYFGRELGAARNLLVIGDAGSGKTMTIRALATELKEKLGERIKFYVTDYSQFTSIYRGGEAQQTSQLFDRITQNEKKDLITVMFIDEIQQVAIRKRDHNEALDTFLTKLDGFSKLRNSVIISATYQPVEHLDHAFVDRHRVITVAPLTIDDKVSIFEKQVQRRNTLAAAHGNPRLFEEVDYEKLKPLLPSLSGRAIGSPHGLVNAVVEWKDDRTPDVSTFTPITTAEIIEVLSTWKAAQEKTPIGF